MRTLAVRRCAPSFPFIRWRGNVLRIDRAPDRGIQTTRGVTVATHQSEGLLRVRDRVGLRTTRPRPLGSLPDQQSVPEGGRAPLRGGGARALRPAGRRALPVSPRKAGTRPSPARLWPSRTGLLDGRDPAAAGRMGLSGSILPGADRGMAERGVSPIHVQGARIGIGAPLAVAQPKASQRLVRSGPCPAERRFRVRPPPKCAGQLWIGIGSVQDRLGMMPFHPNTD